MTTNTERTEYADKRRRGAGNRLVKLPGASGYSNSEDAPELIAKRLRVAAAEKRVSRGGK